MATSPRILPSPCSEQLRPLHLGSECPPSVGLPGERGRGGQSRAGDLILHNSAVISVKVALSMMTPRKISHAQCPSE